MTKNITLLSFIIIGLLTMKTTLSKNNSNQNTVNKSQECIILLHGLARTKNSMKKMEAALKEQGYHVFNIDYPSRKKNIETLSKEIISNALNTCNKIGAEKIHFVTHSMGGILIRYYLSQYKIENIGHVVMLGPPNNGSEVVDKLKSIPGFKQINGPAGQQLGTDKNSIPSQLGPANFKLGIIAGNRSINPILSLLIPGTDDGKVSIESAKLEGMSDFLIVPHTHPFLMKKEYVIRQTLWFIQNGKFNPKQ